jgi:hypothetical protein
LGGQVLQNRQIDKKTRLALGAELCQRKETALQGVAKALNDLSGEGKALDAEELRAFAFLLSSFAADLDAIGDLLRGRDDDPEVGRGAPG